MNRKARAVSAKKSSDHLPAGWRGLRVMATDAKSVLGLVAFGALVWSAAMVYSGQMQLPKMVQAIAIDLYGEQEEGSGIRRAGLVDEVRQMRQIVEYMACKDPTASTAVLAAYGIRCVEVPAPRAANAAP